MSSGAKKQEPASDPIVAELRAVRAELAQIRAALVQGERAFLSAQAAGKHLGIDRGRVSRLCEAKVLRAQRDGRGWKIPRAELERLQREGLPPEPGKVGRPRKKLPASTGAEIRKLEV